MLSSNTSAVSGDTVYVEDVFSTYLYTGTGSSLPIVNNIDLATKGGLVWIKQRDTSGNHLLMTTDGGPTKRLRSNGQPSYVTSAAGTDLASFNSNGFSLGVNYQSDINTSAQTYVSWSLRKQPKFFDVVTWTGNGTNRTISHNLGSVPGCIIVASTTALGTDWAVYHRSLANTEYLTLNSTAAKATGAAYWNSTTATATEFSLGTDATVNYNTGTYIAYLFAHNAGGFGLTGTDNVISCGSYAGNSSTTGPIVNLGYEPQWVMIKNITTGGGGYDWIIADNMRGIPMSGNTPLLEANLSDAETGASQGHAIELTATGFQLKSPYGALNNTGNTYIYIAIRRGPMKVPTDATKVFVPVTRAGTSAAATVTGVGFSPDSALIKNRGGSADSVDWSFNFFDKLRATGYRLSTAFTNAEDTSLNFITSFNQDGMTLPSTGYTATNGTDYNYINYFFKRAPSFFDEVCYTGDATSNRNIPHNLGVSPELVIIKTRAGATQGWLVTTNFGATTATGEFYLESTGAATTAAYSSLTIGAKPTASNLVFGYPYGMINGSGITYVAYLFATCAGVSKVGSYIGTGTTKQIDCGFAAGARFVLIKRTDSTGDWYVWDTARGIVSGNDPYLLLNSTAAEVTSTDYIDAYSAGFELSSTAPAALNASGGSYIFLAIA